MTEKEDLKLRIEKLKNERKELEIERAELINDDKVCSQSYDVVCNDIEDKDILISDLEEQLSIL